jgi:hypothetical protein
MVLHRCSNAFAYVCGSLVVSDLDCQQRLPCLSIICCVNMAPTTALEVLFGLMPLRLVEGAEARTSACRRNGKDLWLGRGLAQDMPGSLPR